MNKYCPICYKLFKEGEYQEFSQIGLGININFRYHPYCGKTNE